MDNSEHPSSPRHDSTNSTNENPLAFARETCYDLERLAIDAVRMRTKLPYELYKEVILSLRARSAELYPAKIDDYLDAFPHRDSILASIEKEVF